MPHIKACYSIDTQRHPAGGVDRSRLALGVIAHERDRIGIGWIVLHVRGAHHGERDPQLLENRAALRRCRVEELTILHVAEWPGEDEPLARIRRRRSGDDVQLGHVAQPGFFATQISSAGHLRAHSTENVS